MAASASCSDHDTLPCLLPHLAQSNDSSQLEAVPQKPWPKKKIFPPFSSLRYFSQWQKLTHQPIDFLPQYHSTNWEWGSRRLSLNPAIPTFHTALKWAEAGKSAGPSEPHLLWFLSLEYSFWLCLVKFSKKPSDSTSLYTPKPMSARSRPRAPLSQYS